MSSSTVYATAYLTEKGRTYLFNKGNVRFDAQGNDLFEIIAFSLGDPDTNYKASVRLASGDIPDITGKSEGCLKATTDYMPSTLVYYNVDALGFVNPLYSTNVIGNSLVVNTDTGMPTNSSSDIPPSNTTTTTTTTSNTTIVPVTTGTGGFGVVLPPGGGTTTAGGGTTTVGGGTSTSNSR